MTEGDSGYLLSRRKFLSVVDLVPKIAAGSN
jgi:hypothetical protein